MNPLAMHISLVSSNASAVTATILVCWSGNCFFISLTASMPPSFGM